LVRKFQDALATRFPPPQAEAILQLCQDPQRLEATPVNGFLDLFVA